MTSIFQYYAGQIKSTSPLGFVSIEQFIRAQQNPKEIIKGVFARIVQAEVDGDKKLKAELKANHLHYFTPCAIFSGSRKYENITRFTGLLVLDFDHIDHAKDLKAYLFRQYSFIIASWLSPSRKGVKCLVRIPVVSFVHEFKDYFYGIATEMDQYEGFDPSGQNPALPLFQSYDPKLLYREDADTMTDKGVKVGDFETVKPTTTVKVDTTTNDAKRCVDIINKGFSNIVDCGHPALRGLCLAIGGYISTGYITESEALSLIDYNIEHHSYLKKGIRGYKQTARWAIAIGKNKSLILEHGNK